MAADDAKPADSPNEVTIEIFGSREGADLAIAQLKANGIPCRIAADDAGGVLPNLSMAQGVRVLVPAASAEAARELLNSPPAPVPNTISAGAPEPAPPFKISMGQILFGIVLGVLGMWTLQGGVPAKPEGPRTTHSHYAANGIADEKWVYRNGQLTCHMMDRNLDGAFDYWAYYDDDGRVARTDEDNNFDGRPDEVWNYSNGDLLTMKKDTDFNGVPDEFTTYKYRIPQQLDVRPNDSKFTTVREFLSNGVVTEIWSGGDSNGNFKTKITYDPFFNPIQTNTVFHLLSVP